MTTLGFKISDNAPDAIRNILLARGWEEIDEDDEESPYHLWWKNSRFRISEYQRTLPWQRLNHFPNTNAITRKDALTRNLKRMKGIYGNSFHFFPTSFNLPNDYTRFVSEYTRRRTSSSSSSSDKHNPSVNNNLWICKPADLSRGRGIFIFKDLQDLTYDCAAVVQQYVTNPLLVSGYKFDLRLYVVVTSFQPLVICVYREGLVRFSTDKFNLSCLDNVYSHLTNTSINKYGPSYSVDKEIVGAGCKWTFHQLWTYLHHRGVDVSILWTKINTIITMTILTQAPTVPRTENCFELYGFDILIDDTYKPWLLEVNFSPALSFDCQTDLEVKLPMLSDLFDLLGYGEIEKAIIDASKGNGNILNRFDVRNNWMIDNNANCRSSLAMLQDSVPNEIRDSEDDEMQEENYSRKRKSMMSRGERWSYNSISKSSQDRQEHFQTRLPRINNRRHLTTGRSDSSRYRQVSNGMNAVVTNHQRLARWQRDDSTHSYNSAISKRGDDSQRESNNLIHIVLDRWRNQVNTMVKVGNYVKIFPFNEATWRACKGDSIDVKTIIREMQKISKQISNNSTSTNRSKLIDHQLIGYLLDY